MNIQYHDILLCLKWVSFFFFFFFFFRFQGFFQPFTYQMLIGCHNASLGYYSFHTHKLLVHKGKGKGICLESRYPRYTCSSDFYLPPGSGRLRQPATIDPTLDLCTRYPLRLGGPRQCGIQSLQHWQQPVCHLPNAVENFSQLDQSIRI